MAIEALARVGDGREPVAVAVAVLLEQVVHQLDGHLLLGAEVVDEQARRRVDASGDLGDRRALQTLVLEHLVVGGEHLAAPQPRPLLAPHRHLPTRPAGDDAARLDSNAQTVAVHCTLPLARSARPVQSLNGRVEHRSTERERARDTARRAGVPCQTGYPALSPLGRLSQDRGGELGTASLGGPEHRVRIAVVRHVLDALGRFEVVVVVEQALAMLGVVCPSCCRARRCSFSML